MVGRTDIARGCCQCRYVPSDGAEYSDDFSTLDPGWLKSDPDMTLSCVDGRLLVATEFSGDVGRAYRSAVVGSMTDVLIVIESELLLDESPNSWLFFGYLPPTSSPPFAGGPKFAIGLQHVFAFGMLHILPEQPFGDNQYTIKLTDAGSGTIRACFFINEELVYEETAAYSLGTEDYGYIRYDGGPLVVRFDDFTLHVGNP